MATRRESVVLSLVDEFSPDAIRVAASARLMRDSLDGTSRSADEAAPALTRAERSTNALGSTSRRAQPDIDPCSDNRGIF